MLLPPFLIPHNIIQTASQSESSHTWNEMPSFRARFYRISTPDAEDGEAQPLNSLISDKPETQSKSENATANTTLSVHIKIYTHNISISIDTSGSVVVGSTPRQKMSNKRIIYPNQPLG
jgi:hypothetical protein